MISSYEQWVYEHENPDDVLPGYCKPKKQPSAMAEKKRYFDELREKIGEEKFNEMERAYQERNARIKNENI